MQITRRTFLRRCTIAAAATGLPLWFVKRQLAEAADQASRTSIARADRLNIALIGCGGMGIVDALSAVRFGNLIAVCDVDETHLRRAVARFEREGFKPAKYTDFRKVLEQPDVDVIINATPDHWHTLINIAAARARKHIYAEKPLTLTIDEGKRLIEVVRKCGVVLQTGTQQRSDARFRLACELVRNGRLGKLLTVTVFVPAGLRGGPFKPQPVPEGLNWDFWLGQAPKVQYMRERCHTSFRWWFEYAGGPMTDWGAHHNDIVRWAIGLDGPVSVEGKILVEPIPGGYNTPPEFEAKLSWQNGLTHIVKTTTADSPFGEILDPAGQRNGIKFEGTDGWLWVNRGDIKASNDDIYMTPLPENALRLPVSTDHMANFFNAVYNHTEPIAPVEEGHKSAVVCHLIAIAVRLGRALKWDHVREQFTGAAAKQANKLIARQMRKPYDYSFVS